jgi:hypothetical protein
MVSGDLDLDALVGGGACRIPIPVRPPQRVDADGLITRVVLDPLIPHPGQRVTLHVSVTNVLDQTRVVDVDPVHAPFVFAWGIDRKAPRNGGPLPRNGYSCTTGDDEPGEPSPERVRLGMAPGATLHFEIEWRASWETRDADCKPLAVELPPGDYWLYSLGPLLTGEVVDTPLVVR